MNIETIPSNVQDLTSKITADALKEDLARKSNVDTRGSLLQEDTVQIDTPMRNQPPVEGSANLSTDPGASRKLAREEDKVPNSGMAEELASTTRQGILQNSVQAHFAISQVRADAAARLLLN
jgi:hypothetical protein